MTGYKDDDSGAIWKNKRKANERHPDFRGNATVGGVDYWVSAWKRSPDAKPDSPALKFRFTEKEEQHQAGMEQVNQALDPAPELYDGDDIAF